MVSFGSLFSGVGGFDLGCDAAGWQCEWQVEWDKKASSVLERHWPGVSRYGDVCDVDGGELMPVDVITFGFPCQDLSVAGQRKGLDGERSGLFFEAMRIIGEMREATGGKFPRVIVAENVVGLLSADGGLAMGRCLDAMAESGALEIEWRILDAQHFGVPQRRRRVFIVARYDHGSGSGRPIFVESEGSGGSVTASLETRQDVTTSTSGGSGTGGTAVFVKARRAQSVDDHETWETDRPSPTLNVFDNAHETRATVLAFAINQREEVRDVGDIATALQASPGTHCQTFLVLPQIVGTVCANWSKGQGNTQVESGILTLDTTADGVRRLTPRECERLQGWPDDHSRWDADGKENADGPRYKMIGNGVAAPVAEWLARQIGATL